MGTESIDRGESAPAVDTTGYCRDVESYLCQKNDGHLIRVVGPSFEVVSGWAAQGIPLKVVLRGIDRYFERYYAKGPRRRPVKIDFCAADVLDLFDEWRRALGLAQSSVSGHQSSVEGTPSSSARRESLPVHLERVVMRLTNARAGGTLDAGFDEIIDHAARELDAARAEARGVRGAARQALIARLDALDVRLLEQARAAMDDAMRRGFEQEADEELAGFRAAMAPDTFARARAAAIDRLVRERFGLPTIRYEKG